MPAAIAVAATIGLVIPLPATARAGALAHPLVLTVQTVPAVGGAVLTLDGHRSSVSQSNGTLVANVATSGVHTVSLSLPADDDRTRYSFVRWNDEFFQPVRQIRLHKDLTLSVGLRIAYLTHIIFADPGGKRLDPARVSHLVLSGPDAELITMDYPYPPVWLQTALPAKHMGDEALHVNAVSYAISSINYDGLSVASQGQERYLPVAGGTWLVHLRLYRLTLRAKDALFGTSLGRSVTLTDPAGHRQVLPLDRNGQASITVGRGNYTARVQAAGFSPLVTIALSRSQSADILVITPIDLAVVGFIGLAIVTAIFAVGRGRQRFQQFMQRLPLRPALPET